MEALQREASSAMGSRVKSIAKIYESTTRTLLLTAEDGQQVVACIPTPICGPAHFSTASEVATMDFLRRLGLPVPAVLAWSSHAEATEVEAEFILMEKAPGAPLRSMEWETVDHVDLVHKVARLHRPLLDLRFTHYGSLYYKDDIAFSHRADDFLETIPGGVDTTPFCMGPVAQREFWEDERAFMDIERGPWTSALAYMKDVAVREQMWIDSYAKPHIFDHFLCGLPFQGKQDDHIEYLECYKSLLPFLIPDDPLYLHGYLWHPNLHAGNLFVAPSGVKTGDGKIQVDITSCVDWKGVGVGPAFLQLAVPELYNAQGIDPELLAQLRSLDTLDAATQAEVRRIRRESMLNNLFERLALQDVVPPLAAWSECQTLASLAQATWRTGLVPFRELLIRVWRQWDIIAPGHSCPMKFSPTACDVQEAAFAHWIGHIKWAMALNEEFSLGEFGYVAGDEARFVCVQKTLESRREEWVAEGKIQEVREVLEFMWPYRDTLADNPRTHLKVDESTLTSDDEDDEDPCK